MDLTEKGTIVITQQPEGQQCAVLGGIMALRMRMRGAVGVVVLGRVRDLVELESTGLPVSLASLSAHQTKSIHIDSRFRFGLEELRL